MCWKNIHFKQNVNKSSARRQDRLYDYSRVQIYSVIYIFMVSTCNDARKQNS